MSFPPRYRRHTAVALPAESTLTNGDSSPMLTTPETFIGGDQPGAALAGDATKPAAKQPAMVKRRKHERGACVRKRLVAPSNIIDLPHNPRSSSRCLRVYFADAREATTGDGAAALEPALHGL